MSKCAGGWKLFLALGAMTVVVMSGNPAAASRYPVGEVLLEGGVAFPYGDLGDDYFNTPLGLGAEGGFEVGLRYRHFFSRTWAVSPAFHYVEFGDFVGVDGDNGLIEISESVLRYGVDLQYFPPHRRRSLHPFFTAGVSMTRNRHRVDFIDFAEYLEEPFNTLALALGGGLRVGNFEGSLIYHVNRFETARLFETDAKEQYNWDYLVVRIGLAFPTE
jgi:hypothetical protein